MQLSVGAAHVCGVTSRHEVVCWGDNAAGQVGVGRDGRSVGRSLPIPHLVGGVSNVVRVAAGAMHTCALDADGAVTCWGSAGAGLVTTSGGVAASVELSGPQLGTAFRMVLGDGAAHSIALSRRDDAACAAFATEVRCWSTFGLIPIDPAKSVRAPKLVVTPVARVSAMVTGHGTECVIADATLSCFHRGGTPSPAVLARGDAFVAAALAIGEAYFCAVSGAGEVRCWDRSLGEFWRKPPLRAATWRGKPPTLALDIGDSPMCTVGTDGVVDCYLSVEQGLPDQAVALSWASKKLAPHPIAGIAGAVDIGLGPGRNAFGYGFGCALLENGGVACFGDNDSGELGTGGYDGMKTARPVVGARGP